MKKKVKPKSGKKGSNRPKTKKINLNENTDHSNAAADRKEEPTRDAEGSTATGESGSPPEINEPLDGNDESESTPGYEASGSGGEENPSPDGAEPGEQATALEVIDPGGSKPPRKKGKKSCVQPVTAEQDKLSEQERTTLNHCLEVIHQGMDTFVQVGSAIATIIVQKLYRETHPTFQRYANEVLGISPRRAYQLKDASDVIENLKKANNCSHEDGEPAELPLPTNENQVRALKNFPPDVQREIWREAIKVAGDKVTARVLAQIIKARAKSADRSAADDAEKKNATNVGSAFADEIEKVIDTLNRAWKTLAEEHRSTFLDRISEWLTSAGDEDSAS